MRSLRLRLILLLGSAIMVASLIQFAASFNFATGKANELFDFHMQQMALALQDNRFKSINWDAFPDEYNDQYEFVIQFWTDDGDHHVHQSRNYRYLPHQGVLGFSTANLENGAWRIFAVKNKERVVQVAQKMSVRKSSAISLALHALWPVLPVSLLLILATWWLVTNALAPLNAIGKDLANRNAGTLTPVSDKGIPQEVALLVAELNLLFVRLEQALQAQQRFLADAAHELRSPLTALRLQCQTLALTKDDETRTQAIERLLGGVDRVSRLVGQLLALAKHDPSTGSNALAAVSVPACVEHAMADVTPYALSRKIRLRYGVQDDVEIFGDADSLRILIRNLLDNAVRYAPIQGQVQIDLKANGSSATLTVQDSGAGIPPQHRERIFDRFFRIPGTEASGSGLGLAIVKAIADRHAAVITLGEAKLGGLEVTVSFSARLRSGSASSEGDELPFDETEA